MSLPKKFHETVNFNNRVRSLNELMYFTVEYEFTLTENYKEKSFEGFDPDKEITGIREFTALTQEQAEDKITNWCAVLEDKEIIKDYKIITMYHKSFYGTLKEKELLEVLKKPTGLN